MAFFISNASLENLSLYSTVTMSNSVYENNDNVTFAEVFIEHLASVLNIYYTPALIGFGCLGNLLSIVVFFRSKLRLQSTSQYLTALAISDTIFLCQLLPPWLKAVGSSTLFARDGYCQLFVYLSYVSCNHSSWLVVAFTIERFVAVVYPLRRNAMCTVRRARHIIGLLAAAALLINLPVLRFAVSSGDDCNIDEPLMEHAANFNLIDTAVSFTLPLGAIVVLNAWIMWGVYRVGRARNQLVRQQQRPYRARTPQLGRAAASSQRSQYRVTRMLLVVSSVFVLLNLPAYTMRIVAYANNMSDREYSGKWAALQQVCLLFFNTNFGINFVLYCMSGQNFRHAVQETFPCFGKPKRTLKARGKTDAPGRASSMSTSFGHSFSTNHTENPGAGNNATGTGSNNAPGRNGPGNNASGRHRAGNNASGRHRAGNDASGRHGAGNNAPGRNVAGQPIAGPSGEDRPNNRRIAAGLCQPVAGPSGRGRREKKVIQRWRFDNSRQLRRESIEMQEMPAGHM